MRILMILPLALTAAAAVGCRSGSEGTEQAPMGVPQRDLALDRDLTLQQPAAPQVEVASPVELGRKPAERPTTQNPRRARRPAPVARAEVAGPATSGEAATVPASVPAPAAVPPEPEPVALMPADTEPPDPHALPPGRSVTVIPASSGPTTDEGWTDQPESVRERGIGVRGGGHGGGCKPRGTGRMPGGSRPGAFR